MTVTAPSFATWSDAALEKKILDQISLDAPWPLVEKFGTIVRSSGSPEEREAFELMIAHLKQWGVPYTLHEPEAFISWPISATLRTTGANGKSFRAKTSAMGLSTNGEISAELVYVPPRIPEGVVDDWSYGLDFTGLDVRGKVVIADGMSSPGRVIDVMKAGGLAGVFVNPAVDIHESICTTIWGTPDLDSQDRQPQLPVIGVDKESGDELIALAKQGGCMVTFSTVVDTGWRKIPVLVAEIPGATVPDEFVLLHGHVDSWHQGVGDNATGDATMLEIARVMWQNRSSLKRGLKIGWWSGHSHGRYAGSTWFADEFGIDLARGCVAQVNCDSPGCRWATTFNELTVMSETLPLIDKAIRDTTGVTPQAERPPRAGDYSFNQIGISSFYMLSSTMSQADRDAKGYYPVGGCGANIAWHTEDDLIHIADKDNLLRDMRMYAASVLRVMNAPLLPFDWRQVTSEFKATLAKYQKAAGTDFDFGPAVAEVERLDQALAAFYASAPATSDPASPEARRFNRAQRMLARILVPVNYSRALPFFHDPALEIPALPDLEPATTMPKARANQHDRGVLRAHLQRGRNRLIWALDQARESVEAAM
jgi:N-acetylated-alpha-linked acidic dipeptidase